MRNRRKREMDRFVSYDTDTAPVIIEPRAAAFLPSIMFCNWEPDRRMSHSCDLMGNVGSLFIAIAPKGRGNRLAETDISSSGSRVDVDFRACISEKFLTIYQNF